jgi:hypothetical protein
MPSGRHLSFYEVDTVFYEGSNGCPVFCADGKVFGMVIRTRSLLPSAMQGAEYDRGNAEDFGAFQALVPSSDIIDFAARKGVVLNQGAN